MKKIIRTILGLVLILIAAAMFAACGSDSDEETPPTPQYTVGGTVSGLKGTMVLQCNGADDITITGDGAFTFSTKITDGNAYSVTMLSHTASGTQKCTLSAGSGTLSGANVTGVQIACSDYYFFDGYDTANGVELWRSDGTADGTVLVKDIYPAGGSYPLNRTNVNGVIFFTASDSINDVELWKSDGTADGTVMVKDIWDSGDSIPAYLTNVNGTLYFSAYTSTDGNELWRSDGTAGGTVMVKDINGTGDSYPMTFANANGTLFFAADDGTSGHELWRSDGTAGGTVRVKDIYPDAISSNVLFLTDVNGTLYFRATDGTNGYELWKSDGTEDGTVMVKDIYSDASSSYPGINEIEIQNNRFFHSGGTVYFGASTSAEGTELWKSDGTADGTVMVKDIESGVNSGFYID